MHIKQVIISGFRSFRSQNEIESFSPKHNVIVGRNGSGKSNFFDAIQFVLVGPRFSILRQEDRQHLLHEGAGSSVMAAYVEIIFDNSDGRLPVESDEVILRRTVGLKKDEFFLNRKRVQKNEVISLLESAGFSKSNPYYIVQQGKVSNLCVMKDIDRLNLLKEVAGTTVYEERRSESLKIIQETVSKQDKVNEVLSYIDERLSELEKEKKELTEYEALDKQRRAIEFNIYDKEYSKANDQLKNLESQRGEERSEHQNLHIHVRELQDEMVTEEEALTIHRETFERMRNRLDLKMKEVMELTTRRTAFEVQWQESSAVAKANETEMGSLGQQLEEVNQQINQVEKELNDQVEPKYLEQKLKLDSAVLKLSSTQTRMESLYGKQGRGVQFKSKKKRDTFLKGQLDALRNSIAEKNKLLKQQQDELVHDQKRLKQEDGAIRLANNENVQRKARCAELQQQIQEYFTHRTELHDAEKQNVKDSDVLQEQIAVTKQELERGKQQLSRALPRHINHGLAAVKTIVEEQGLRGYFGPVVENFTLRDASLQVAVEVAAMNGLFHVIVDNDETAAHLMKELDGRNAGRLTFLPLNRLQNASMKYPNSSGNEVRSLIEVALDFDPVVEAAIKHVFGKKLLAKDLDIAAKYSKEFRFDCITKEGDIVNYKGGFEGGFHDERSSRLAAVELIRENTDRLTHLTGEETKLKLQLEGIHQQLTELSRTIQSTEAERGHLYQQYEQFGRELGSRGQSWVVSKRTLESRTQGLSALEAEISLSESQIVEYESERQAPLHVKLTDEEREELVHLEDQQRQLKGLIEADELGLMTTTAMREQLQADLTNNLFPRKADIERKLLMNKSVLLPVSSARPAAKGSVKLKSKSRRSSGGRSSMEIEVEEVERVQQNVGNIQELLNNLSLQRENIQKELQTIEAEINEMDNQLKKKSQEISKHEKSMEERRLEEQKYVEKLTEVTANQDRLLNKRNMLLEIVQSRQRLIRDLGTLPRKEMEEYRSLSEKQLLHELKDVNEQLKQYSSVNRKALDQFVSFNEQRDILINRKNEMGKDSLAIQQLIESLDAQKEEAIFRTFHTVNGHFGDVFNELVPEGRGVLIMQSTLDQETKPSSSSSEEMHASSASSEMKSFSPNKPILSSSSSISMMNKWEGIQVKVSFVKQGHQFDMMQLSGGQKALVALALIFAIQRCDPAPFYLFDEIDQALDANYRSGIAKLIQRQAQSDSAPTQFITTTFRPELVQVADKCYGIAQMNKVSNIYPLDQEDAQVFVNNLMLEEEAVGQVEVVPSYRRAARYDDQLGAELEEEEDEEEGNEAHQLMRDDENEDSGFGTPPKIQKISQQQIGMEELKIDENEEEIDEDEYFESKPVKKGKGKGTSISSKKKSQRIRMK